MKEETETRHGDLYPQCILRIRPYGCPALKHQDKDPKVQQTRVLSMTIPNI